jgi:YVTN family beta-propeller protein
LLALLRLRRTIIWLPHVTELPSGTVTFLFTDVEGSTRLLKQLGEEYGDVLDAHQSILRAAFAESNGQEIDTQGDSFFVAFSRAKDAVAAAVEGQRRLAAHPWPDEAELRVRMGVHTGEPVVGPERYVGLAVHRAARVMAAGHGGQILLSSVTRELVADDLGSGVSLRDLGECRLKDLDRPERLFQVVGEGLASEFPPLRTQDAPTAYSGLEDELAVAAEAIVRPRVSRRTLLAGLAIGVVAAAAIAVVVVSGGGSKADLRIEPNSAVAVDPGTGKVVASVPVGSGPVRVAAGAGALWVANQNAGTVSRIDPVTKAVVQTIDVGSGPAGIAVGDGAVWVANASDGTLSRINVDTNTEVQKIPGLQGPRGVAYGEGSVWVATLDDRSVTRVDPATGAVLETIPTGGTPTAIAVGAGSVWVTNEAGSSVLRISPQTNTVTQTINVGNGPGAIAVGLGSVWVANTLDGTVSRINATTGTGIALVRVGEGPRDIAIGREAVWVANEFSGSVSRISPRTNNVTGSTTTASHPTGLAFASAAVWVTVRPAGGAHRGGTFTFAVDSDPVESVDPGIAYSQSSWQILSLTGDGLTAFKRVGGSEGTIVVPDLATNLPTPTDSGRTYTFQLRSGIRYSTGALVEPTDIRGALERDFELGSAPANYYSDIVGASACTKGRRCNLSRGIIVAGDTIIFHLVAPDPEFLQKLAVPFAYVVPSSTPRRTARARPPPGTGPYAIVSYDPKRRLELKRNPHFHEWSSAARPDGYPDAIVMKIGISDDAATTDVERGRLDYTPFLQPHRMNEAATRYGGQLHSNAVSQTSYLLLNTRLPPFDVLDARRALSYALDRNEIIRRAGGSRLFQATCQILPPNFPGYTPYCPYTIHPSKTGSWRAPDLAKARRLIARSGTTGTHVTVLSPTGSDWEGDARYVVQLLDRLGYRASRRALSFKALGAHPFSGSRKEVQIFIGAWVADYPSPGAFIQPVLSCTSSQNDSGFCNPKVDAEMRRAKTLEPTDPQAADAQWAHIDRELVNAAPWIPYLNGRALDFVSKRVGNFQLHPEWGVLFDQLWVR